jgi:protocatechuate 3,4-dioxygenase beta subunit
MSDVPMRRTWPILALAVAAGLAVFLVARGTGPAARRVDPVAPAASPAKAALQELSPDAAPEEPAAPAAEPLQGDWTITGRVLAERAAVGEDGSEFLEPARQPVAGAAVRVRLAPPEDGEETPPPRAPREVATGRDGRFAVASLPGETPLEIQVDAPGNALRILRLELDGGVEGTERRRDIGDIVLQPECTLVVRLVDPEGAPVEGAKVVISDLAEQGPGAPFEQTREALERSGGEYAVERLPPVGCSVEVSAAGWAPAWESVELPREEPVVIRLDEGDSLSGIVRASTGEPIAGAHVIARDYRTFPDVECETDRSGRFQLRGLRAHLYEVEATAEGFHQTTRSIGEGEEIEIWLVREAVVEGKVLAEEDESPIARAAISLKREEYIHDPSEVETDDRGDFELRKVLPGTYEATIDHPDYLPVTEGPWNLESGESLSGVTVHLRRGFTAHGTVTDVATGEPIERASVSARRKADEDGPYLERRGKTDESGKFDLRGLAPGDYTIEIKAPGYLQTSLNQHILEEAADLAFALEKGGSISGRVLDPGGRPLPDVCLVIDAVLDAPPEVEEAVRTRDARFSDRWGRYVFDGLPPFDGYLLHASHDDHCFLWARGLAVPPRTAIAGLDIRFPRGGSVRGRVLDQGGMGMEGVTVELSTVHEERGGPATLWGTILTRNSSQGQPDRSATTTADGKYEIENVAPGLYRASATTEGWASQEKEPVHIRDGLGVDGMDFVFEYGAMAAGRVVDGAGRGAKGAVVEVHAGGQMVAVTADGEGRFRVKGFPAGRVDIFASKDGSGNAGARIALPADDILLRLGSLARITGRVESPGHGAFSTGEVLIATIGEAREALKTWTVTDETGRFSAAVEPGPSILVIVTIKGFAASEVETTLAPGEQREVVIPLRRGGTIEGAVVSRASGEPIESPEVCLEAPDGSRVGLRSLSDWADGEGAFSIDDVPEGPVVIVARHGDHRTARRGVQVIAGETALARIELEGGQGIHGTVSRLGKALPGARVAVPGAGGSSRAEAVSGTGGLYEVLGLAPGEHEVSVEASGPDGRTLVLRRRVTVEEGQLTERDLDLGTVLVTGRVLRNGSPAADIAVAASIIGEDLGTSTTSASGEYSLELPGGREVDLEISADGKTLSESVLLPEGPGELRRDIDLGAPSER